MKTLDQLRADRLAVYKQMQANQRWGECRRFAGRMAGNRLSRLDKINARIDKIYAKMQTNETA